MSALSHVHALGHLVDVDATWRLLRADKATIIVGLLSEHLGSDDRRLSSAELYERLDHDLEVLRAQGFELPQSAQGYCADWRKAGFLIRRPDEESRGETFELSAGALRAIRILEELTTPTPTVTESRLASIGAQLNQLAVDTDPDAGRRLEQLHQRRAEIDAQIERINAGELHTLDADRALERVRDVLGQAREIPSDFARVRGDFEQLNRDLRARILESDDAQKTVLNDVFRGVNHIDESDEGRTFAAFSALVLDPAVGAAFDDSVALVLSRDFAAHLSAADRRILRRFVTTLKREAGEIHDVITSFARGLRRYVQSQDYQRDRVLRGLLRDTLATGIEAAAHAKPYQQTSLHLELSAVALSSVGAVRLHDPADVDARQQIEVHAPKTADLAALRALARQTEIDYGELTDNVNELLARATTCSIAEVLRAHPASQGVASVVGLITLAADQGVVEADSHESVRWRGDDGVDRAADIPLHRFTGRLL